MIVDGMVIVDNETFCPYWLNIFDPKTVKPFVNITWDSEEHPRNALSPKKFIWHEKNLKLNTIKCTNTR